ncbi:MAG: c-type cytochrome [Acidobacteriaceae bacterium]
MKRWGILLCFAMMFFLLSSVSEAQDNGAAIFQKRCVMCLGANGNGDTPTGKALKAVDFRDPQVVKASDADLATIISRGKKMMPAFGGRLSSADIDSLVSCIRTLPKNK